jgi:hypothetical protein
MPIPVFQSVPTPKELGFHANFFVLDNRPTVRGQGFWDQERPNLRESLAHLVGLIMRRAGCDASVALRVSFV